tara:strand:+ start:329 stop:694 length:366 start_codon:yes stop_codon:yes gene_type:complete
MNDKSFRWYHYLMMSFSFQFIVVMVAVCLAGLQMAIYSEIDKDVETFNDVCQVEIGSTADDFMTELTCDDENVSMETLSTEYLHIVLTEDRRPVITCTKTISEYLKSTKWACEIDPEEPTL